MAGRQSHEIIWGLFRKWKKKQTVVEKKNPLKETECLTVPANTLWAVCSREHTGWKGKICRCCDFEPRVSLTDQVEASTCSVLCESLPFAMGCVVLYGSGQSSSEAVVNVPTVSALKSRAFSWGTWESDRLSFLHLHHDHTRYLSWPWGLDRPEKREGGDNGNRAGKGERGSIDLQEVHSC